VSHLDDAVRRRLQEHFSDALVTIVGSGYPAELGIPGMRALADELLRRMPEHLGHASAEWDAVAAALAAGTDLETALDVLPDDSVLVPEIVALSARFIGEAEALVLAEILQGGLRLSLADLLPRIAFAGNPVMIATNYDRVVELAVELAGYALDCSFVGAHACHFDVAESLRTMRSRVVGRRGKLSLEYRHHVRLWKPHGSLDWFLRDGKPFRTPYAVDLPRLMITPGASKYRRGYDRPFDQHREEANRAIDAAARYLTIGYGFNDPHLQTHLEPKIASGAPTVILARTLSATARDLVASGSGVIALERSTTGGTLIHAGGDQEEVADAALWSLNGFYDEVFG
jgi:hypothetical protein